MAEMIHNKPVAASLKGFLASLTLTQKDFAGAEIYCREALPEYETVKNLPGIAEVQMKLAKALIGQGRKTEAIPYARHAVEIRTKLDPNRIGDALTTLNECEE
jgi:Tetratricopeptide repeat